MRLNLEMLKEALNKAVLPEPTDVGQTAFILIGDYRDRFIGFDGTTEYTYLNLVSSQYPPIKEGKDNFQWEVDI